MKFTHYEDDFLFGFDKTLRASILHRFRDVASYLSNFANFNPHHLYLEPPNVFIPGSNFESLGYRMALLA